MVTIKRGVEAPRGRAGRALGRLAAVGLIVLLSGCLTVQFVEDYDPVLDEGLSVYQGEIASFIAEMGAKADLPEGAYEHADVQAFYARTGARLQGFVDRAEAVDEDGTCKPAEVGTAGLEDAVSQTADLIRSSGLPFGDVEEAATTVAQFANGTEEISGGNCTVVILKVLRANHNILRTLHETNGTLPKIVGAIAGPTLDQSVRIALKNEVAKKNR